MSILPTLFVSHGAPTFALEPGDAGRQLRKAAADLPAPRAILIASPHWMSSRLLLTTTAQPETIHDFGGFPDALYELRYPAPGAPECARQAIELLDAAGFPAGEDPARGLDHGAWVPLMHLFPDATIPVVQVSLQRRASARYLFDLGRALEPLRRDGVLIIGSGSITHNLYEFRGPRDTTEPYVTAFTTWIADTLAAGDVEALLDYRRRAPHAERAHPTDEHLLPLMFAIGAAGEGATIRRFAEQDVRYGMLAMDSYAFGM